MMTKNRARKQATRKQMAATGEPYTLAARSVLPRAYAWTTEDEILVVYGTHDAEEARRLTLDYYEQCGIKPGDFEWYPELPDPALYASMEKSWTNPKDNEEPFDRLGPGPGRVPYTWATLGQIELSVLKPEVWVDDRENLVIYGTHDPMKAMEAVRAYEPGWFDPNDMEWFEGVDDASFYEKEMKHYWTHPKDDEEFFDAFHEFTPGRIPYLLYTF